MNKKIIIYLSALFLFFILSACDKSPGNISSNVNLDCELDVSVIGGCVL